MDYGTYKNNLSVVLTQACTDTDTVLHIDNAGAIPVLNEHGLYLTFVDTNEIVEVTSVDTTNNTITVVRGLTSFGGGPASSHNSGTKLSARVIAEHFDNLENNIENNEATINSHVNNTSNPHNVTASQVGINSTDDIPEGNNNLYYKDSRVSANSDVSANTSARHTHSNKSLLDTYNQSNADITDAVNKKHTQNTDTGTTASEFYIDTNGDNVPVKAHIQNTNNPHNVTASQIGAIAKIEDDATPKLGGDLDGNSHNIDLDETTHANQAGIIYKNDIPFIHDFNYGDNGTVTTEGRNLFIGLNAGNFTMGSDATATHFGSYNTGIGANSFHSNTTGHYNTGIGANSFYSNTTGSYNIGIGANSLYSNTTGYDNVGVGLNSLYSNTTGSKNVGIGLYSGRYIADGSTANETSSYSIYIGAHTKALADGDSNEIVIGYNQIGYGSNTVRLGNFGLGQIGTTLTPRNNHDLVIELTNNTTLRFKLKGTDGKVRTATITLS